jgi:hypothetical protein
MSWMRKVLHRVTNQFDGDAAAGDHSEAVAKRHLELSYELRTNGEKVRMLSHSGEAALKKINNALQLLDSPRASADRKKVALEMLENELDDCSIHISQCEAVREAFKKLSNEVAALPAVDSRTPVPKNELLDAIESGERACRDLATQFRSVEQQLLEVIEG